MWFKNLLCKIRIHWKPYLDSAMFSSAMRCSHCDQWLHPKDGAKVEQERQFWDNINAEADEEISHHQLYEQDFDDPNKGGPSAA